MTGYTPELTWAARVAQELLAPMPARWRHTLRVVEQAQSFRGAFDDDEFEVLLAAAYLHDVGYAPELTKTGFHPLDGARFVRRAGHERLAGLVAHHSASDAEADERGFAEQLAGFPAEDSPVARALTYCDLTTGPSGERIPASGRLTELSKRLGEDDPVVRAVRREAARLAAVVQEMELLLASPHGASGGDPAAIGAGLSHAEWRARVPDLVVECREDWGLRLGEPYAAGAAGYTTRVELTDGTRAVLKLIYPHRESEHEADALERWDGQGAVRLLARDDARAAMLIERCEPGTQLSENDSETALNVLIGLLPRLWRPAGAPFRPLAEEAAWWVSYLADEWERAGRPFERRLLEAAVDALDSLAPTQGEQVLLHQDLHAENVLAAEREPWLVIDPKPLVGEREFALAPIVRAFELGHSGRAVLHRLDRLTSELGLDRERTRGWTIGQTIAWAFDSTYLPTHAETARWLLESS